MLICTQWRIYLQWYVADIHVGLHVEVATLQANDAECRPQYSNTPQRALSRQIVAGVPVNAEQLITRPFVAGIITLKTVLQSDSIYYCYEHLHSIAAYS